MFTYRLCNESDKEYWIAMNREFMAEEIQDDDLISLMIFEEDDKPVGFANLMTIYSIWTHGKALILDDLYLRPQTRGKGYGKQALVFIEQFAKKRGCKRFQF